MFGASTQADQMWGSRHSPLKEGSKLKSSQRGGGTASLLLWMAVFFGSLLWLLSDYTSADAEDLRALSSLAAPNSEARADLAASLKGTPNPNRAELRRMRRRVNEILVTATSREATGDETLESPSQREAALKQKAAARTAAINAKAWRDLNAGERAELLVSSHMVWFAIGFLACAFFGWRAIMRFDR